MTTSRIRLLSPFCFFFIFAVSFAQTYTPSIVAGPDMNVPRMNHQTVVDADGSVLLIGGHGSSFVSLSSYEVFVPGADTLQLNSMQYAHDMAAVGVLDDGRILAAGGAKDLGVAPGFNTAELYNPLDKTWSATGSLTYARCNSSAATLRDGRILVLGGWYEQNCATYGEVYDPATASFNVTGALNTQRANPIVIATQDSGAIIIGGMPAYGGEYIQQVEFYDPETNTFSVLKENLFGEQEGGWLPFMFSSYNKPMTNMQLDDGRYVLMAYNNSTGKNEYTLFTVDPVQKTIEQLSPDTTLPNSDTHYFMAPIVDNKRHVVFMPAIKANVTPTELDLFAITLEDTALISPDASFVFPESYYLGSASFQLLNDGRILLSGGHSETGYNTNFSPVTNTFFITPNLITGLNESSSPLSLNLQQNYPNPFNPVTTIRYDLPARADVSLTVYNILGQKVATLVNGPQPAGKKQVVFNATGLSSGIYVYVLKSAGFTQHRRMVILK